MVDFKKISKGSGYLGIGALVLSLYLMFRTESYAILKYLLLIVSMLAIVLSLIGDVVVVQGPKEKRMLAFGAFFCAFLLIMALFVLNLLGVRYVRQFDMTEEKIYAVSDQTKSVLQRISEPLKIIGFFKKPAPLYYSFQVAMREYQKYAPLLQYEVIDPTKNPARAQYYEITKLNVMLFEKGKDRLIIDEINEEQIVNALLRISRGVRKTVCWIAGHEEKSLFAEGDDGASLLKQHMQNMGLDIEEISLGSEERSLNECHAIVMAGSIKNFFPVEMSRLRNYLRQRGRWIVMLDPLFSPELKPIFKDMGLEWSAARIIEPQARIVGTSEVIPVIRAYKSHAVTAGLREMSFFPDAQSIDVLPTRDKRYVVSLLAQTSSQSWAERDLAQDPYRFDPGRDFFGPLTLSLAVQYSLRGGEGEGRWVLFGDSDFIKNRYVGFGGNRNFYMNALQWVLEDKDFVPVPPKRLKETRVYYSEAQATWIHLITIYLFPFFCLIFCLYVWLRGER